VKKSIALLSLIIMVVGATAAFAGYKGGGEGFPTFGQFGGQALYSTDFAPDSIQVIDMKTKNGYTNIAVDALTKYQLATVKATDGTAIVCSLAFGGYSSIYGTTKPNAVKTSGIGPWHAGDELKTIGVFNCTSSTGTKLYFYRQK
jgi:hypothetical protein